MTRARIAPESLPLSVLAPPDVVAALDREVERLRASGVKATRSDVMRAALGAWAAGQGARKADAAPRTWWRRMVGA